MVALISLAAAQLELPLEMPMELPLELPQAPRTGGLVEPPLPPPPPGGEQDDMPCLFTFEIAGMECSQAEAYIQETLSESRTRRQWARCVGGFDKGKAQVVSMTAPPEADCAVAMTMDYRLDRVRFVCDGATDTVCDDATNG